METEFDDPILEQLYTDEAFTAGFSKKIVKAFRKRIQAIISANDERDLYNVKGNHFEKLQGKRQHQRSLRLNDKMRLIVEIRQGNPKNTIIIGIEDYH